MATIYEVSELAGVSLATVSRVMNNSNKVSLKTRLKVESAMAELDYRPNSIAQSLATKRSNSVGILIPELHGPFFGVMLSSIESELRAAGKHVIITAGHSDEADEKDSIEFLLSRSCDALILHVYSVSDDYIKELSQGPVPIILLNRLIPEISEKCISLDNEYGGYIATRSLLELGHRNLAYISGPHWKLDAFTRLAGHKRALQDFGLEFDQRLSYEGDFEEASGQEGMTALLETGLPFTGVICANDEMAAGTIAVAREHNFAIPDDLSIIGFDNVFFTRYLKPQLSSIGYPIDEMGQMAARSVLKNVYGQDDLSIQNSFKPELILRASVGGPSTKTKKS